MESEAEFPFHKSTPLVTIPSQIDPVQASILFIEDPF
jgi:hypothetical protein